MIIASQAYMIRILFINFILNITLFDNTIKILYSKWTNGIINLVLNDIYVFNKVYDIYLSIIEAIKHIHKSTSEIYCIQM